MTHSPAAAAARMRRIISARTLCALAPMAARSRTITSLNKWPKNNHCGVRRVRTEPDGAETGPSSPIGGYICIKSFYLLNNEYRVFLQVRLAKAKVRVWRAVAVASDGLIR